MDPLTKRVAGRYAAKDKPSPELIQKARRLGEQACENGLKAVPAHDPELGKLLESEPGHPMGWSLPLLKAWSDGWTRTNLK